MSNPFQQIRANSNDQKKSFDWYMKQVAVVAKGINSFQSAVSKDSDIGKFVNKVDFGQMYLFAYNPKHRDTLPYYDRFPLCLPIEPAVGGFVGMNLHYLSYGLRAQLLGKLIETANDKTLSPDSKMLYNWDILKNASRFPEVKACTKRYLSNQMQSRFLKVNPQDWKAAIFLPIDDFQKASAAKVHRDSREMIQ